jgi:hypothetical protein
MMMKLRNVGGAEHVARMEEMIIEYKMSVGKPAVKRRLGGYVYIVR